ncbi:MAG: hypothetical protein R2818_00160 [Flavobacteriales bacterium]
MRSTPLIPFLFFALQVAAQPQLENAGYEDWTELGTATEEPAQWSSVKTSDGGTFINNLAPQLCWRSDDAHTGSYSVNLRTVNSLAGAAAGLLTNGRVHAEFSISNSYVFSDQVTAEWNTLCSSRPDSLVGWYKAAPQPGDFAKVTALMHVDEGKIPVFNTLPNWVGTARWQAASATVTEWTRFSVPFVYLDERIPEFVLLVMTSGDSTNSVIGTEAWFDDLALIYNMYSTPDVATAYVTAQDGFDLNVGFSTNGEPVGPTDLFVELSDENGDFASAVLIGSMSTSEVSGSVPCTIPAGTLPGNSYRIRVNTSSPYYAPVDAGIIIEVNTALSEVDRGAARIRYSEQGLVVDLQGTDMGPSNYELIDARGAIVGSGSLRPDARNTIPVNVAQGMLVVRVVHANGALVQRVFVP